MTPAELRALIAASDGSDQGEILEAAYLLLIPKPDWNVDLDAFVHWDRPYQRFHRMVEIGAHESAALMIAEAVLPGWGVMSGQRCCRITSPNAEKWALQDAPNRALAIIDAVCAAVERKDETNG